MLEMLLLKNPFVESKIPVNKLVRENLKERRRKSKKKRRNKLVKITKEEILEKLKKAEFIAHTNI